MSFIERTVAERGPELCVRYNQPELCDFFALSRYKLKQIYDMYWSGFSLFALRKLWLMGYMYRNPDKTVADLVKEFGIRETYFRALAKKMDNGLTHGGDRGGELYRDWFKNNHPCDAKDRYCHLCAMDPRGCEHRSTRL